MSKCGHPEKGLTCGPECQPVAIVPSDPDDPRFDGVVVSRSVEKRVALQKGEPMPTFASGGALSAPTEIDIVKRILSAHQTAYAQTHNTEGRNVFESDQIAIGYASVELAKLLAAHDQKVRDEEREKVATWMMENSFATGHGDTTEDLLKELTWQVKEERDKRKLRELREVVDSCDLPRAWRAKSPCQGPEEICRHRRCADELTDWIRKILRTEIVSGATSAAKDGDAT